MATTIPLVHILINQPASSPYSSLSARTINLPGSPVAVSWQSIPDSQWPYSLKTASSQSTDNFTLQTSQSTSQPSALPVVISAPVGALTNSQNSTATTSSTATSTAAVNPQAATQVSVAPPVTQPATQPQPWYNESSNSPFFTPASQAYQTATSTNTSAITNATTSATNPAFDTAPFILNQVNSAYASALKAREIAEQARSLYLDLATQATNYLAFMQALPPLSSGTPTVLPTQAANGNIYQLPTGDISYNPAPNAQPVGGWNYQAQNLAAPGVTGYTQQYAEQFQTSFPPTQANVVSSPFVQTTAPTPTQPVVAVPPPKATESVETQPAVSTMPTSAPVTPSPPEQTTTATTPTPESTTPPVETATPPEVPVEPPSPPEPQGPYRPFEGTPIAQLQQIIGTSADIDERAYAMEELGLRGNELDPAALGQVSSQLVSLALNPQTPVENRQQALWTLGMVNYASPYAVGGLGQPGSTIQKANQLPGVSDLIKIVGSPKQDPIVREAAVQSLMAMGEPVVFDQDIQKQLKGLSEPPGWKIWAKKPPENVQKAIQSLLAGNTIPPPNQGAPAMSGGEEMALDPNLLAALLGLGAGDSSAAGNSGSTGAAPAPTAA